jgi:hypothetical protein
MKYRFLHVSFWQDPDILEYSPEKKLFYVYLLTNPHTTQSGIYEISYTIMKFETGLTLAKIKQYLKEFVKDEKIDFDEDTCEIFVLNWMKYNWSNSPKVIKAVLDSLNNVKSKKLLEVFYNRLNKEQRALLEDHSIRYGYSIDTVSEDYGINKKEKEKEKEKKEYIDNNFLGTDVPKSSSTGNVPYQKIVDLYHKYCPMLPKVRVLNKARMRYLRARWQEFPDLNFWEQFFKRVANSKFLTGRADYGNRTPFVADFEWLIRPTNFIKVLEGRYDNRDGFQKEEENVLDKILAEGGDDDQGTIF